MHFDSTATLRGKTVLITGASGILGLAVARRLARLGAHLLLVCRDEVRGEQTQQAVRWWAGPQAPEPTLLRCDLSSLADVHRLCDELLASYPQLDILINNAAVLPAQLSITDEGHELCWAINHLAPFVLTNRLLPLLTAAEDGRVINVTSDVHWLGEVEASATRRADPAHSSAFTAYCDTKLANILFTQSLAERLELTNVAAVCLHPGLVRGAAPRNHAKWLQALLWMVRPFAHAPEQAAESFAWLATTPLSQLERGRYYKNFRPARTSSKAANRTEAHRLWRISATETGIGE